MNIINAAAAFCCCNGYRRSKPTVYRYYNERWNRNMLWQCRKEVSKLKKLPESKEDCG